ncbi:MAG TPA: neuraminidase-like domain-containing protein [Gemmatimonadaceae bacterium]|nr:neuraminidase-like domain-containing protein [Gemmatimonadaceae bacterium]
MDKAVVQAFDRDMRAETLLGDDTVVRGRYEIRYRRSQFVRAEKGAADIVIKVLGADGQVLHTTPIHYNAPDDLELDVTFSGVPYAGPSEWERLSAALLPLLEDVPPSQLREDEQFQDVSFLAGETGTDLPTLGTWIAAHVLAERLARDEMPLLPEVLYAFLQQGQPSAFSETLLRDLQSPDRRTLLEDKLLRGLGALNAELQESLLRGAIAENTVPARLEADLAAILVTLQRLRQHYVAENTIGGGKGTVREILQLTETPAEKQAAFVAALSTHTGPLDTLWKQLEEQQVLEPEEVRQVRLSLEVGALTRNHVPLVGALLDRFRAGELTAKRELATLDRTDWIALFQTPGPDGQPIGVPTNVDGETPEERMEMFAAVLEEQLERAYPTAAFAAKLARSGEPPVPPSLARRTARGRVEGDGRLRTAQSVMRADGAAATAATDVARFFSNNPEFQLDRYRVEHYVAEHDGAMEGIADPDATIADLKTVQRVFKLKPTFDAVRTLLDRNIDSAQQIYFMGQGQFVQATEGTSINRLEAKQIYRKAENTYALALAMFGDYNVAMNGAAPAALPPQPTTPVPPAPEIASSTSAFTASTAAPTTTLPNLQALFGSLDYCECTHCQSVYSPAAHFVDVMRFLGDRGTQGSGIHKTKNVRQVLLERRPDLGDIELSCENTNTPLPYIDLVNELLEEAVAPTAPVVLAGTIEVDLVEGPIKPAVLTELTAKSVAIGGDALVYAPDSRSQWVVRDARHAYRIAKDGTTLKLWPTRQTFLSAAELRANPEYTNDGAYLALRQAVFPLELPFDLPLLQARAYLEHLGVPHPRLLELFQQKASDDVTLTPTAAQVDAAWLGISDVDRQILTGTLTGRQSWEYWGLQQTGNDIPNPATPSDPTTNVKGTWIEVLGKVDVMLHRAGLTYRELLQLLDTRYVNASGSIHIEDTADPNTASCDTSLFTIEGLTQDALDRAHRFVRLWRKLGIPMWELDLLLPDTDADPATVDKRITAQALQDISRMVRLRSGTGLEWRVVRSLYQGIDHESYVDRSAATMPPVQTLYERLFRNKLVDAVASFPARPADLTGTIENQVPGILAAFRIKEPELALILGDLGIPRSASLTAQRLGEIHRVTVLASALGLGVDSFLRLKRLWGQDPFANPAATLQFVELAGRVAASGFSVPELDYLLAHRALPSSGIALDDRAIAALIDSIREGLQRISEAVRLGSDEKEDAYVRSRLGLLPALEDDADQATALGIIDGSWEGTATERDTLIESLFVDVFNPMPVAKAELAEIPSTLSPADRQAEVDDRFAYVQPELEEFILRTQTEELIRQKTADALGIDVPSAAAMLDQLHLSGDSSTLMERIDDARLLMRNSDGTYQHPTDETTFPAIFQAFRLLHKAALVARNARMRLPELRWWLEGSHAADMGWMRADELPIATASPIAVGKWLELQQFFTWAAQLPTADLTPLEFASRVLDATVASTDNLADLAALTGWDAADLDALVAAFHWREAATSHDVVKQELRKSANLVRLADAMRALRRMGVNASRALAWASAQPSAADADSLKQTVKSKYDLAQWQEVIRPLQDEFRERKRQALVAWLVARPDQAKGRHWVDADGLYSHFLIDVEMSACALTSRLKQATASAQLFVQRCLLNLETDIVAKTDIDPKWKQWKWMKRYRVWEANRKVFLYPENWIEPELRDEKSPFFKDLEQELQQNEVTTETAEQAYRIYLEKLDKVANLEIRAMHEQTISADESVLHVIGRTRSSMAPEYFYRRRINGQRWTAWEPTGLDITSDHLVAGVHNRRLYLLWPQFLLKGEESANVAVPSPNTTVSLTPPARYWEIRLCWSEMKNGKWTPKVLSDSFVTVPHGEAGGNAPHNVGFRTRLMPQIHTRVYRTPEPLRLAPAGQQLFEKLGPQVSAHSAPTIEFLVAPAEGRYYNNLIQHTTTGHYFYFGVGETSTLSNRPAHDGALSVRTLKGISPFLTYSVLDSQAAAMEDRGSFFLWDPRRTYFVDYVYSTSSTYYSRAWHTTVTAAFKFFPHYHPFVELFVKELNIWGIKGLLNRRIQVDPTSVPGSPAAFDFASYQPEGIVTAPPVENVDFDYAGPYALYNWELFFHAPFFIANKLSANQRFEEALEWFHYIFDPTSADPTTQDAGTPQQRFWITKPFYSVTKADYYQQKIERIMLAIAKGDAALRAQVREWRDNPFNPHLIARMRTVAYQKNVLIKYIQTLVAWGDQLFRQDTIESINEATQLYILASSILGPRPKSVPRQAPNPVRTFYQLEQAGIDPFGNVLREVENLLPVSSSTGTTDADTPELPRLDVLYFGIPNNEKLLTLWDTVGDRLFKIRHCMSIDGVVRQLPLFDPPIDPAALVKAAAAGVDIGSALSDLSAPLPLYRFSFMIQRAQEVCAEVKALGSAMLAALERRDAESLSLLRSGQEMTMLNQVKLVRASQVDEALRAEEALKESRKIGEERKSHYTRLLQHPLNPWEIASLSLTGGAIAAEIVATVLNGIGTGTSFIPEATAGVAGVGGTPEVTLTLGGRNVTDSLTSAAEVTRSVANILQMSAGMTATLGSQARRSEEWEFMLRLAEKELPQIDKQIAAATLRHTIATQELHNHVKQIEQAQEHDDFLRAKFTSEELYDWMVAQLATVYFQSYQLAYDVAKRAERCFRYELGLSDSSYIQFGSWDGLKKGLLAGERLSHDLRRLETAYHERNRREYELTKHVSLAQLDPVALLRLRQNGECFVDIPETAFDMDYPGHYFRRLKSVSLSIPCTVGPYTTVGCTLTLTSNQLRKDSTLAGGKYARDLTADDPRFRDEIAAIQSIATSNGRNDAGLFELSFRDERYLPFEGAGAISSWHVKLNKDLPPFDFTTIADVIIHLEYTAREGGELLRAKAVEEIDDKLNAMALAQSRTGLFRVFDLKREYPDKWYRFLNPANPADDQAIVLDDLTERLPYFTRKFTTKKARRVEVVARMKDGGSYKVLLSPLGTAAGDQLSLASDTAYTGMHRASKDLTGSEVAFGAWTLKLREESAADFKSLAPDAVDELFLITNYTVA